ncbi:MAG: Dolichyl-phosphate-mannose-protein mannosyltransferase [Pseudomonadota bacterium]
MREGLNGRRMVGWVVLALLLRALPMLWWGWATEDCTRDECIFRIAARPLLAGEPMGLAPRGWLPAPGYPYLLAACEAVFGSMEAVKWLQWAGTVPLLFAVRALAIRQGGPRVAELAVALVALHPTLTFFVGTLWTESLYTLLLVLCVLFWVRLVERPTDGRAVVAGATLGVTVLFRGMATWWLPMGLAGAAWIWGTGSSTAGRAAPARIARRLAPYALSTALVVAPWSLSASARYGGWVVSDATLGHVAAMGNDTPPPFTFDYGIGLLTGEQFAATEAQGRSTCPVRQGPLAYDACERARAVRWASTHPGAFLARVPVRWAQMLNPHSFLTRHVLWGFWPGLPWAARMAVVALQAGWTVMLVVGGALGLGLRPLGLGARAAVGMITYYAVVIGCLYGISRFRLPLEPLLAIACADAIVHHKALLATARATPRRGVAVGLVTVGLLALMGAYLSSGFPGWLR